MKKILGALLIVLVLASQAWPASLTLSNLQESIIGNLVVVTGTAAVNSGDTLIVPRISTILFFGMSQRNTAATGVGPSSLSAGHRISTTGSQNTVTINVSVEAATWEFFIAGF